MEHLDDIVIKFIHPTNNLELEAELSVNFVLRDLISLLIDEKFLYAGGEYVGELIPSENRTEGVILDNNKTVFENGIVNNDIMQLHYNLSYNVYTEIEKKEEEFINAIKRKKIDDSEIESLLKLLKLKMICENSDSSLDEPIKIKFFNPKNNSEIECEFSSDLLL